MKRLLVSVRDAAEARLALHAGVDLIDVKEPNRGALGAADAATWRDILACVAGQTPVSCALGELADAASTAAAVPSGMRFIKVGLAGAADHVDWADRWTGALSRRHAGCDAAAVVYADWRRAAAPEPDVVLEHAVRLGCSALLVDTFDKRRGTVFNHWPAAELSAFLETASQRGLTTLLGGGLNWDVIDAALVMPTDFIAVRGLACGGNRNVGLDLGACRRLVDLVHHARRPDALKAP